MSDLGCMMADVTLFLKSEILKSQIINYYGAFANYTTYRGIDFCQ
jgi:hypothetical protein